jgi:hypothetical protein
MDEQALKKGLDPYRSFPLHEYLWAIWQALSIEPVIFIEKSRTMICSWIVSAFCAHMAFTKPATSILFLSADQTRSDHDIKYAKVLWEQSPEYCRSAWPLRKPMDQMPLSALYLQNDSRLTALPGDPNKARSEHPTIGVIDEAAFIPSDATYNVLQAASPMKLICLSSAETGWFEDICEGAKPVVWPYGREPGRIVTPEEANHPLYAMSPIPGLLLKRTAEGHAVLRVHHLADPDKQMAWRIEERKKYTSQAYFDKEIDIKYRALSGQSIYPEFNQAVHVVDDASIPPMLTRYMSIDPHMRTPTAMLWVGIDQWGDWWVYRELWPSAVCGLKKNLKDIDQEPHRYTPHEYVETAAKLEGNKIDWINPETDYEEGIYRQLRIGDEGQARWVGDRLVEGIAERNGEKIVYRFMDQAGKGFQTSGVGQPETFHWSTYVRYGFDLQEPNKKHATGEDAIHELLKLRHHDVYGQWPRIHIARSCKELIVELEMAHYKATSMTADKELSQQAVDLRTHMIDNLRYLATGEIGYIKSLAS